MDTPSNPFDTNITDELLSTTRAVRKRLDFDKPVDPAVILECIALAQQAPTATNEQNWRWVVVTDADKKAQLADIYRGGCLTYLERGAVEEEDEQTKRVYQSALQLAKTIEHVPVLVIPCVERRLDGLSLTAVASTYGSILPAAWSFVLALRSRGLGTVWTTAHLSNERAAAELLGIPEGVTQVAMFPVAHTIGFDFKPADRPPPETHHVVERVGRRDSARQLVKVPSLLRPRSSDEYAPVPWDDKLSRAADLVGDLLSERALASDDRRTTAAVLRALDEVAGGGFYPIPAEAEHDLAVADEVFAPTGPVIDVQTHIVDPARWHGDGADALAGYLHMVDADRWSGPIDAHLLDAAVWATNVFAASETAIALLTSTPGDADHNVLLNPQIAAGARTGRPLRGRGPGEDAHHRAPQRRSRRARPHG